MTNMVKKSFASFRRVSAAAVVAAAAITLTPVPARAAVNLSLNSGGNSSIAVHPGSTFTVSLNVTSTSESLTGVDYYFTINGAAAGKVRLTGRDLTGSPFVDPNMINTGDNGSSPGVLDANFSLLNPKNSLDLGATLTNVSVALPPNTGSNPSTYLLGKYTFSLDPNLAAGNYTLSTTSLSGSGAVTQAPFFSEQSFSQPATFSVIVTPSVASGVPEPTGAMALLGFGGMALRRRRR